MIFSRIDRFVSFLLVASLLLCCVPALAVPAAAADTEMYLYNGVELPDINAVWTDKETYPYAILVGLPGTMLGMGEDVVIYSIVMVGAQPTIVHGTFGYVATVPSGTKIEGRGTTNSEDASNAISPELLPVWKWGVSEYREAGENESLGGAEYLLWSSHDILNEDGTVYLAASDPVPVNPPSSITSVSIVSPETVQAGLYFVASVDVSGTGDFDSSATLTLSGNSSSGTYLKKGAYGNNWTLFCGSDETASTLTLTAASVQDSSVTASKIITVEQPAVDPTDPTIPSDPDDPDPSDPTVPEETQPGNSGSLTDKSGDISDGLGDIHDFEQSQKDVLDNNMDFILGTFAFDDLIPALAFVGLYVDKAFVSMVPIQLIYFVPLVIGLFFFICSRAPGATRWKPRRPPSDPTKKK